MWDRGPMLYWGTVQHQYTTMKSFPWSVFYVTTILSLPTMSTIIRKVTLSSVVKLSSIKTHTMEIF